MYKTVLLRATIFFKIYFYDKDKAINRDIQHDKMINA